ncbi:MAG: CinA family protein [bacterium]|nr:CinA family protein [bacterium]
MENILFQNELDDATLKFNSKLDFDVARLLKTSKLTLSVAETVTGGMLAQRLTSLPGSLVYFKGGVICIDTLSKINICGASPATLRKKGEYSKELTLELANGVKNIMKTDISIAITGHTSRFADKKDEVFGKINAGFMFKNDKKIKVFKFNGTRNIIRYQSTLAALGYLRQWLLAH